MNDSPMHEEDSPPRQASVGSFWIDETKVTNRDVVRFLGETGYVALAQRPLDPEKHPGLTPNQIKPSSPVFFAALAVQLSRPTGGRASRERQKQPYGLSEEPPAVVPGEVCGGHRTDV